MIARLGSAVFGVFALSACTTGIPGGSFMAAKFSLTSDKTAAEYAQCVYQGIDGSKIAQDGEKYTVTKPRAVSIPRFDFVPAIEGGSIVEYDNRLGENEELEVVRGCA